MEPIYDRIGWEKGATGRNASERGRTRCWVWRRQVANNRIINRVSKTTQFVIQINVRCANKTQVEGYKFTNPITRRDSTFSFRLRRIFPIFGVIQQVGGGGGGCCCRGVVIFQGEERPILLHDNGPRVYLCRVYWLSEGGICIFRGPGYYNGSASLTCFVFFGVFY